MEGLGWTSKPGSLWYLEDVIKAMTMDEITQGNSA